MKTLTDYIKSDLDLDVIKNRLELGRSTVQELVEKISQNWQQEIMKTEWYEENGNDIALMLKVVKANNADAKMFLEDLSATS